MGGENTLSNSEDEEEQSQPPLKRLKLSSPNQEERTQPYYPFPSPRQSPSPGIRSSPISNRNRSIFDMASPEPQMVGRKKQIRRVEFVRIITQALYSLGYPKAAAKVEKESGISLQLPIVSEFRKQIFEGKWDDSVATLEKIGPLQAESQKAAIFIILQQKFLEQLIVHGNTQAALTTLRTEISPLGVNTKRVHELASCVVCTRESLLEKVEWKGSGSEARTFLLEKLQELLPPQVMIPERRLEHLVEQALAVQREGCVFHNSSETAMSLFTDHQCGRDQIPTETVQVLEAHGNEVWYLQFSHDGRHLASASKDCTAIIWEVIGESELKQKHMLTGHSHPVSLVAWSPDDSMILTCGNEETVKLWDIKTGECKQTISKTGGGFTSCAWFPDCKTFLTGCNDKCLYRWDLTGAELEMWRPRMPRVIDMAITPDGKNVVCICHDVHIRLFNVEEKTEKCIEEDVSITSLAVSGDGRYILVNLVSQEIHLWDLVTNLRSPCKFKGHRQGRYVIRSCFGGSDHAFVVSGSEDSQVYIWHKGNGELLEVLAGHSGTVNCVSWNPRNPHMFASASDDHTIRIWGLGSLSRRRRPVGSPKSNGYMANGGTRELLENLTL